MPVHSIHVSNHIHKHPWYQPGVNLQVLVEPVNSLAKRLFLGELVVLVAEIRANGEPVSDTAVQVDLPVLAGLDEDFLGLVTKLCGEDLIDFCVVLCQHISIQGR